MKKLFIALAVVFVLGIITLVATIAIIKNNMGPVSSKNIEVTFEVKKNATYSTLGPALLKAGLIKSEFFYKVYVKLEQPGKLYEGIYILNKNMSIEEIVEYLSGVSKYNPDLTMMTFKEGINIRKIASVIEEATENKKEDVFNLLKDKEYVEGLINQYWFLTDDILNKDIYYPLEGYLFPETYQVSKKYDVKKILKIMLDHTDKILSKYKEDITNNKKNLHEFMTLASIIELEAGNSDDRAGVAGVFYNRLNARWSLGSDVTTYYASKIDDWSYSLTYKELNNCSNKYNTRCNSYIGLPVGPISNPSEESIKAAISPKSHKYYYFVADCKGKTYLNYNSSGHAKIINELKAAGNWCV